MNRRLRVAVLVVVGVGLMVNPLYLPVAIGEPSPQYVHQVEPAPSAIEYTAADVIAYGDLEATARDLFDRALADEEHVYVVDDPDERAATLSYPEDPRSNDGLLIVGYEDIDYVFWTSTVHPEPTPVWLQRLIVQPVVFLVGFFSVLAGVLSAVDAPVRYGNRD